MRLKLVEHYCRASFYLECLCIELKAIAHENKINLLLLNFGRVSGNQFRESIKLHFETFPTRFSSSFFFDLSISKIQSCKKTKKQRRNISLKVFNFGTTKFWDYYILPVKKKKSHLVRIKFLRVKKKIRVFKCPD